MSVWTKTSVGQFQLLVKSMSWRTKAAEGLRLRTTEVLLKKKENIPYYVSSTDQPSEVHHSGSDLLYPNIQLLPQRLMGSPDQETVYRGADLPLEAQNHQDRVRYARKKNTRRDEGTKEVME